MPVGGSPTSPVPTLPSTSRNKSTARTLNHNNATAQPSSGNPIGIGLRQQTTDILLTYKNCTGLTMASSFELADIYFPQLGGWFRVLGAPSLETLQTKAERARINGLPYEALGYGLETSQSTPEQEWRNLIPSTQAAKNLVDGYDKLLVMGPGFRLMSRNEDKYAPMASWTDVWMLQTQQLQKEPPGPTYREQVRQIVDLIRTGRPDIKIWAQITLPPDREPDAAQWLEYRQLIVDLVDGTYIGVYTWDQVDNGTLKATIETIFETVCMDNSLD
jgi:hypothetical protein